MTSNMTSLFSKMPRVTASVGWSFKSQRKITPKFLYQLNQLKSLLSFSLSQRKFTSSSVNITDEEVKEFQANGVVCLRNAFSKDWVDLAYRGMEKNLANPSKYCDYLEGESKEEFYFNDYLNWNKIDEIQDYVLKSPAAEIAGLLMQSQMSAFFHEHIFIKKKAKNRITPWHHDQAYYPLNGMKNCTVWMPSTPVSKETALKFVKGSHLWGKWFIPTNFESLQNYAKGGQSAEIRYEETPEINENEHEIVSWDLEPGDCLVFHMKTLHGISSAASDTPRYVIATRWVGEDVVLATRPWSTSPPPEILPTDLKIGERFCESKGFPTIWKKPGN